MVAVIRLRLYEWGVLPCGWRMAPICWLDTIFGCRWRRICDLHDRLLQ